jgi:hypothetical protein
MLTSTAFSRTNALNRHFRGVPYNPKGARKFSAEAMKISELPFGQSLVSTRFKLELRLKIK